MSEALELDDRLAEIEARLDRVEKAITTTAVWLAQTPGVWGERDVRGIEAILTVPTEETP